MIYQLMIWSGILAVCSLLVHKGIPRIWKWKSKETIKHFTTTKLPKSWELSSCILAIIAGISFVMFAIFGLFGALEMVDTDDSSMPEYNQALKSLVPQYNGEYICKGTELRFKGVDQVQFEHKGSTYQVNFPVDTNLAKLATYCPLNLKVDAQSLARRLKSAHDSRKLNVEVMLRDQEVPLDVENTDRVLMSKLLNTLRAPEQKIVKQLVDKREDNKLQEHLTQPTSIKVPKLATSPNKEGTITLSDQEMLDNISAQ